MNSVIRKAVATDESFLRDMLYTALFVPPGSPPFPPDVVLEPKLAHYVDGFGKKVSDIGFIAEVDARPVAAAWVRQLTEDDPGYGFLDATTPELSVAVMEEHRGRGTGTELLLALLRAVPRCSLSVDRRNPAIRLYERLGFVTVATDGESVTMVRLSDEPTETALVIPVPAAEPVVGRWRDELDSGAEMGVPAHVTVLYPFAPPSAIDSELVEELRSLFSGVPAFPFELNEVCWFGDQVAWLAPEPAEEFSRLTRMISGWWPQYPPYRGEHEDVVPHLTIGDSGASAELLNAIGHVGAGLPIRDAATEVWLMAGSHEAASWKTVATFRLGTGHRRPREH